MGFLEGLEQTDYAQWILVSSVGWPLMLTLHAIGLAICVGLIFAINLRLLGLYRTIPYTSLNSVLNIAWVGIIMNFITGFSIFMTQASSYVTSIPFIIKFTFIILGCVNVVYTQKVLAREAVGWEAADAVPPVGTALALSSIAFWMIAVVTGRLIAYL